MPISFPCPHCQKEMRAMDHLAGRILRCPGCLGEFTVPKAGEGPATAVTRLYTGPERTPPVAPAPPVPAPAAGAPGSTGIGIGTAAAVGVAGLAAGAALGAAAMAGGPT